MEFLNEFIELIVVGICLCVGFMLKNVVPSEKINKFIPLFMGVLGVILNTWIHEFAITPEIILGGLVSGLASTGMHQAFKQFVDINVE